MLMKEMNLEEPPLSEGEKFIEEYFLDENIKYVSQKIVNVSGDSKAYRVADFYLPKYEVYVEFFGRWNDSKEERERYREKKHIYFKNRIPCVYIYPENLGILDHAFHYRIKKVLKEYNMRRQLRAYLFYDFNKKNADAIPYLLGSAFLLFMFLVIKVDIIAAAIAGWVISLAWVALKYIYDLMRFFKARRY
jgi:hypothetical protein